MSGFRTFFKYWLPVLLWMMVIYSASGDRASFQHSSRIIGPLVHWLFPAMPPEQLDHVVFVARKGAHLTEYAILALLLWRALRRPKSGDARPWNWSQACVVLSIAAIYAATDEFHQLFVPSRQGAVWDVLIDTGGAALGLLLLLAIGRRFKLWRNRDQTPPTELPA